MARGAGSGVKWYFQEEQDGNGKVRIHTKKGPLKLKEKEYGEVVNITTSKSDTKDEKLKVECKNAENGIALKVTLFDFTGSDFSSRFKSSCYSAKAFVDRCKEVIWGKHEVPVQNESPSEETSSPKPREERSGCSPKSASTPLPSEQGRTRKASSASNELSKSLPVSKRSIKPGTKRKTSSASCELSESPPVPKKSSAPEEFQEAKESESSDVEFLREVNKYAVPGLHKVLATCLIAPRPEYRLRELDSCHLEALKQELLSRPMTCSKPMIVVAKGLTESTKFKEEELDSYQLEVIGGNHRREVILQILKDSTIHSKDCFKFVYVQVYSEMETVDVLRLSQLHNQTDRVYHEMNSKEKVALCKQMLEKNFNGKKSVEWRKTCATVIGENVQKMETVFFLSGLEDDIYGKVLDVMEKYGRLELKGQRATKKTLTERNGTTIDCPSYHFRPLRGDLTKEEMLELLKNVEEGNMTFAAMKQEASRIKEVKEVQHFFINQTGSENWEEVEKRFPLWVLEEKLQAFRGQVKNVSHTLKSYVQRALKWEEEKDFSTLSSNELQVSSPSSEMTLSIVFTSIDVQKINNLSLTSEAPRFSGSPLIFLELPKEWDEEILQKFLRSIKSINTRHNVDIYHIIMFSCPDKIMESLEFVPRTLQNGGLTCEIGYVHSLGAPNKKGQDSINLNRDIIPFFVCHWGKCTHSRKMSSLFQVNQGRHSSYSDADTDKAYKREKPVDLYQRLIAMYDCPHSWILDLCSGTGSAAAACAEKGLNCIIAEKDEEKLRMIRRRMTEREKARNQSIYVEDADEKLSDGEEDSID